MRDILKLLSLKRPLVILDVETTGTHPQVDRIVQIGIVKIHLNGQITEWETNINPGIRIPSEVVRVHGINDELVVNSPTFKQIAPRLAAGIMGCDFGGFNVRFDLLFLKKEFARVGGKTVLNGAQIVDPFRIYCQMKPRTLSAAVREYLGEDLPDAHNALVDARAAARVFQAQLEAHPNLPRTVGELHEIFFVKPSEGFLDPDGRLSWRHGEATINFGKHATVPLKEVPTSYMKWILDGDFSPEVKSIIRQAIKGVYPRRESLD